MNNRLKILREKIKEEKIDGFVIYNPVNIEYLIGLKSEGVLLITKNYNVFLTDTRYIEEAKKMVTIEDEIIVQDIKQLSDEDLLICFEDCDKVGFEENYITYANYRNMLRKFRIKETIEGNNILESMRIIKSDKEVEYIETACNITDSCFLYLQDFIKVGMTERQVAFEIEKFFWENGADGLAFDSIVASGKNTSMPHAIPTDKKIEYGDPVLIDFGAKYKSYCADMTRTIFMGEVSEEQKKIYKLVKGTQERALSKMKEGADTKDISKYVANEFSFHQHKLIHALGHGVGMDIHEKPFFSSNISSKLMANMVVTDEPGIYIPGEFGIRIEDTILINKLEPTLLTKSNKNLIVI